MNSDWIPKVIFWETISLLPGLDIGGLIMKLWLKSALLMQILQN
jgi:hypothetical protein